MTKHFILAAAAFAAVGSPALSQTPVSNQVAIGYTDLDLSAASDVDRLNRRIRSAIETACGPESSADPRGRTEIRACRAGALSDARAQRDSAIARVRQATGVQIASQR